MTKAAAVIAEATDAEAATAALAWERLAVPDATAPRRVLALCGREAGGKTQAYLLPDAGPGGVDVVAKLSRPDLIANEHAMIAAAALSAARTLRGYGTIAHDNRRSWLFTDAARGAQPSGAPLHRGAIARWLADLHGSTAALAPPTAVADLSLAAQRARTRETFGHLHRASRNRALDRDGLRLVDAVLRTLAMIDARWDRLEQADAPLKPCLVHGDLVPKNMLVDVSTDPPAVGVFDWAEGGWGTPLIDYARIDLPCYGHALSTWYGVGLHDLEEAAAAGRVLRLIASVGWEAPTLGTSWIDRPLRRLGEYHEELERAMRGLERRP
jgi:hypothetical protein